MLIEAWINDEVLTREEVPEEYLVDIPGASWQQNAEARGQIIHLYLEAFKKKMEKVFGETRHTVSYVLVFQSKFNKYGTDEDSN
jgi:hypothetical protein